MNRAALLFVPIACYSGPWYAGCYQGGPDAVTAWFGPSPGTAGRTAGHMVSAMKLASVALVVALLGGAVAAVLFRQSFTATAPQAPAPAKAPPIAPAPESPQPPSVGAVQDPKDLLKNAELLPELPKADAKSTVKALLPDNTLYLETKPDGSKRVLVVTEVCLREGPLEVFLCKKNTKEHESIVRTTVDARYIHAALVAAGGKPGSPVQFVNPKTGEADYKPASGTKVLVSVHYKKAGKLHTHPAQDWILDLRTKKPMAHQWVFAGSRFLKNPERPTDPDYYTANSGEVIAISNFVDSMLDLPVEVSRDNADLNFNALTEKIPPLLSKVWVILEPVGEKGKK